MLAYARVGGDGNLHFQLLRTRRRELLDGQTGLVKEDFLRIGERLAWLGLPTVFVFEGGSVVPELGINVVNVLEGFETAA